MKFIFKNFFKNKKTTSKMNLLVVKMNLNIAIDSHQIFAFQVAFMKKNYFI